MNEKGLELKIKTNIDQVTSSLNSLKKKLKDSGYEVKNIQELTDQTGKYRKVVVTAANDTEKLRYTLDKLGQVTSIKKITTQANKAKSSFSQMFNMGKIYAFWNMTTRLREGLKSIVANAIDFVETTNKFEVSMRGMKEQGYAFVDEISERFGLARDELMNYQSTYNNIMKSLSGITKDTAYSISESITKMAIDYASLYNVATEDAMTKFQSALVGSVRPIRSDSGYDITETTIGEKAKALGVDTPVRQLTQMEKRLLRIIVLMDQMKETGAMGDFSKTINQPANQLKILSNQLKELGIWIGNIFINKLGQVLPYINGFVMALKEIAKMLALFVGYTNEGVVDDPLSDLDTGTGNVSDNLGTAVGKAKELKKILMGFDVLNVIQTPSSSSGGSGSEFGTIDPKILEALEEYDNLMDNVSMKATEIRDKILDWLGFTKDTNGQLKWSSGTLLKNLYNWWNKLNGLGKIFIALGIVSVITKTYVAIKNLVTSLLGPLFTKVKQLVAPTTKLINDLKLGIQARTQGESWLKGLTNGFGKWYSEMKPLPTLLTGVTQALSGMLIFSQGFKDFTENGNKMLGVIEMIGGTLLTLIGTFTTVSAAAKIFGIEMSASLAAATAGISLLVTALVAIGAAVYKVVTTKTELEEYTDTMKELGETAKQNALAEAAEYAVLSNLTKELGNYIDANGKVKEGHEARVKYILSKLGPAMGKEYKLTGNQIIENGKAVTSYKKLADSIDKVMLKLKAKAILEAKHDVYIAALKDNITVNEKIEASQKKVNDTYAKYQEQVNIGNMTAVEAQKKFDEVTKNERKSLEELLQRRALNNQKIQEYSNLEYDVQSENYEKLEDIIDKHFGNIDENIEGTSANIKTKIKNAIADSSEQIELFGTKLENARPTLGFSMKLPKMSDIQSQFNNKKVTLNGQIKMSNTMKIPKNTYELHNALWSQFKNNGLKLEYYAQGGMPDVGEMFVAREAGPELVGTIGNKSTVMNNQQIVQAVSQGVAQAVSSVMGSNGGSYYLYIDGQQITDVVTKRMNRMANITGGYAYGQ